MDAINLEWRRQFATSRRARLTVLVAVGALCVSFALFLWWFVGAWVVLPFAGLEIGCVAFAFWWLEQAADDRDLIEVTDANVKIVCCRRQRSQQTVFNRGWLSTELKCDSMGNPRGLRLNQSGRSVELAEFLPVSEQHRALRDLRKALSSY
jgi:uncharacterized membrane protein